ncbi:MAG: hypothetical protein HYU39_01685 [Thaumarchaeota archaeon]|nr:hypothetical protein [Nitrososphaerota archaeon]
MVDVLPVVLNGSAFPFIAITIALLIRQRGSYFRPVQLFLIAGHLLMATTLIIEFLRDFISAQMVNSVLTAASTSTALLAIIPLTVAATVIGKTSVSSPKTTFLNAFKSERNLNRPLATYSIYLVTLSIIAWLLRPFSFGHNEASFSNPVYTVFDDWYSIGLFGAMLGFIAYPARVMMLKSRQVHSQLAARALLVLPISWVMIAVFLYFFKIYLVSLGLETAALGNLLAAVPWLAIAYFFRKTTVIETFLDQTGRTKIPPGNSNLFSTRLGVAHHLILGKKMLLEFDPSSFYVESVKDFIAESGSSEVLLITRSTSPLHLAVSNESNIRSFALTPTVTFPKEGKSSREILLPYNDRSIILDAVNKAINANPNLQISVVLDIISDLIISMGNEQTYSFLAHVSELFSTPRITALYLFNPSAHDPMIVSSIRGLFSVQIHHSENRLSVVKAGAKGNWM